MNEIENPQERLLEAAKTVIKRITPTMEGSVDGDYLGGVMYHSDSELKDLRAAVEALERERDGLDEPVPDYAAMTSGELRGACGQNAAKWAKAFAQCNRYEDVDEGVMLNWFASAIEHSIEVEYAKIRAQVRSLTVGLRAIGVAFDEI